jgi:hypothetical protein
MKFTPLVIASEQRERGNPAMQPSVLLDWIASSRDALLAMTSGMCKELA